MRDTSADAGEPPRRAPNKHGRNGSARAMTLMTSEAEDPYLEKDSR